MRSLTTALIVIDVQNDFCPDGALAVADGDAVVGPINEMIAQAGQIILTQDWHPSHHMSFASQHKDAAPFVQIDMPYGAQTLWPDHCIQGSVGAGFHSELHTDKANLILRKGTDPKIDSYSAFFENDHTTSTGLSGWLEAKAISKLILAGLATDYCVAWSALDAAKLGYDVSVVMPACRAIDLDGSLAAQIVAMKSAGIGLLDHIPSL